MEWTANSMAAPNSAQLANARPIAANRKRGASIVSRLTDATEGGLTVPDARKLFMIDVDMAHLIRCNCPNN